VTVPSTSARSICANEGDVNNTQQLKTSAETDAKLKLEDQRRRNEKQQEEVETARRRIDFMTKTPQDLSSSHGELNFRER
jgi:hypothetical protein